MKAGAPAVIALLALVTLLAGLLSARATAPSGRIVLIGGEGGDRSAHHAYAAGVGLLQSWLVPVAAARGFEVIAYPAGWPEDPHALDGAATVVLYFDGLDQHPLLDASRRQRFEVLMARGTGVVVLHQASTVPPHGALDLRPWLGAQRRGTFDRTTESAKVMPVAGPHPITRGLQPFVSRDEFYPTLEFASVGVVPILQAELHVQYRQGAPVREHRPEQATVGWAYTRADGGRAFGYTGAHFLAALEQPMLARTLLNAILWTAKDDTPGSGAELLPTMVRALRPTDPVGRLPGRGDATDWPTFHADAARSGTNGGQRLLSPDAVAGADFGMSWESPVFDSHQGFPPRLYASPLYLDRLEFSAGPHAGRTLSVVFAATSNAGVYAVNADKDGDLAPGRVLWHTQLGEPCRLQPAPLDGVPTGILSTPVIDRQASTIYLTSCDATLGWQAFALDVQTGRTRAGWPVRLDEPALNAVNRNAGPHAVAPTRRFDFRVQRGALNLSPDRSRLYVTFGETETGWIASLDTMVPALHSAFAAVSMPHRGSGGIWGAGGPAVAADGHVYVATGSGFDGYKEQPHDWTQSVLKLSDQGAGGLALAGTYTPFNHCTSARMDIDLGSGGVALFPADPAAAGARGLLVLGGKQGNAYLLDRDRMPGRLDWRPACREDASTDASLLPPGPQPQFGSRGPLNIFGPYSETDAALDLARARSVPAVFVDSSGRTNVFMSGTSKAAPGSARNVAPSLVRMVVVDPGGASTHLRVDAAAAEVALQNPGSPVVSSNAGRDAVVWLLDQNAPRSALLSGSDPPQPILHAFDAHGLKRLWSSEAGQLGTSGKYNEPVFTADAVVVGTDRLQAFGILDEKQTRATATTSVPDLAQRKPSIEPRSLPSHAPAPAAVNYAQRCAVCHDSPQGNVPPRSLIATRSHAYLVEVLTTGAMRMHAAGLRAEEIHSLARYMK